MGYKHDVYSIVGAHYPVNWETRPAKWAPEVVELEAAPQRTM